ncbi:hypothetical protein CONLIGDRAFT_650698 [Coniochaeta ligniaria NRRL 30616]|uniref:Uncharacterized protein n=1 Tax=Coniochaeta ligniaria NRRL 30616 TaxID=1408157 RepID=A0A1J7IXD1_9PEZI|nr:hypothetical protein CONLIGDRAFT_650698 [Coniochaeta ligniaria NRRL 30616]
MSKPVRTDYYDAPPRRSPSRSAKGKDTEEEEEDDSPVRPQADLTARISEYKLDLDGYQKNGKLTRLAPSLVAYWSDPAIRGRIQAIDKPHERGHSGRRGSYTDYQIISKIIRELTIKYDHFLEQCYLPQDVETIKGPHQLPPHFEPKLASRQLTVQTVTPNTPNGTTRTRNRGCCTVEGYKKRGHTEAKYYVAHPELKKEKLEKERDLARESTKNEMITNNDTKEKSKTADSFPTAKKITTIVQIHSNNLPTIAAPLITIQGGTAMETNDKTAAMLVNNSIQTRDKRIIDSGANEHVVNDLS